QEMGDDSLEALGPTTSAAPLQNRQMIWTGTPPSEGMNSEVFTRLRTQALEGTTTRVCWLEWSMDDDGDIHSQEQIAQANPAMNRRVGVEELLGDQTTYYEWGFARELAGLWKYARSSAVIDPASWDRGDDGASTDTDPVAF